jgi:hypothetical protein
VEGSLVVNVGDYLSLLSGGRFISPLHRVTMPETAAAAAASEAGSSSGSDGSRTSLVFFAYPEYAARLSLTRPEDAMRTSLLQQQQEEEEAGGAREQGRARTAEEAAAALAEVPFGEYILNKWGQVSRL